jgi:predicted signal transduction protein with EAL and GGDEF domain
MKYLIKSIRKFREDALPNMMYDVLQWLGISIFLFGMSIFIPEKTTFNAILLTPLHFTIYQSVLIILGVISLTTLCISLIFKARLKKIQGEYQTDELTGLKNYKALTPYLEERLLFSKRNKQIMSIVLIDIDNFADINKKVGYNTADAILKKVGMLLGNDKRATDETFRYFQRGDEFLIVLNKQVWKKL